MVRYQLYSSHNLEFSSLSPLISKMGITIVPIVSHSQYWCENSTGLCFKMCNVVNNQSLHCHQLTSSGDVGKALY